MKTPAFPRIARHLNYRRSFPTPVSAIVHIPTLPYEAFDNTGAKIQPWSLLRLFESVRAYSFWEGVSKDWPDKSMIDKFKIYQDHRVFIIGSQVQIDKSFHDLQSPKFPLYVRTYLKSFGKSSKTVSYELCHEGSDVAYVTCDVTDVLISKMTRKPVNYPDWWTDKYSPLVESRKTTLPDVKQLSGADSCETNVTVSHSDTDTHRHTNWSSYIKYCSDSFNSNIQSDRYANISQVHLDAGIRSFSIVYKGESILGDQLMVTSWEDRDQDNTLDLSITKGGALCAYSTFSFYS